jgi:cyclopropane-fatty-acyl-phospholipid synthase
MIRLGIRRLLSRRRKEILDGGCELQQTRKMQFIQRCSREPIAAEPDQANNQHYEVPAAFYEHVLGSHLKYSCCYWGDEVGSLDEAEEAALAMTCERAQLDDGQRILELGCGWGSLSLWMAKQFPHSQITAVSNSQTQRRHIEQRAASRGLTNLSVRTADINDFDPDQAFDRVVSVEMFEHVRNHAGLMQRVASWLNPGGKLFVHLFCHRSVPYFFEPTGKEDWMAANFFSGGVMPSDDLLLHYQEQLTLRQQWRWNGRHYARTCNAWLENFDERRTALQELFDATHRPDDVRIRLQRWRMFFMACAELFSFEDGNEWWVSHYLFEK